MHLLESLTLRSSPLTDTATQLKTTFHCRQSKDNNQREHNVVPYVASVSPLRRRSLFKGGLRKLPFSRASKLPQNCLKRRQLGWAGYN